MLSLYPSRGMETSHSPTFLHRLFIVLIRVFKQLALLPQVPWQGAKPGRTSSFLKRPSSDFYRSKGRFTLSTAEKENIAKVLTSGSKFLTYSVLEAAQMCVSLFIFPGKSEKGFHSSVKSFKSLFCFLIQNLTKTPDTWMNNKCIFSPIYSNFPNS